MLRDLGPVAVVARVTDARRCPTSRTSTYGVATPFGTFVRLDASDVPAGTSRRSGGTTASCRTAAGDEYRRRDRRPARAVVPRGRRSRRTTRTWPRDWRPGGTTPTGVGCTCRSQGGNPIVAGRARVAGGELVDRSSSAATRRRRVGHAARRGSGLPRTRPTTAFLEANALFAAAGAGRRVAARAAVRTPPTSSTSAPDLRVSRGASDGSVVRGGSTSGAMSAALVDTRCSTHSNGPRPTETAQSQHSPIVVRMNASHTSTVAW